ncbi:hypothetical protein BSKO_02900 [Bryopsis sp. KO-2023]|nr:hypothetical protein BSKO_02900 [Bryopsis sp. KO-2023]
MSGSLVFNQLSSCCKHFHKGSLPSSRVMSNPANPWGFGFVNTDLSQQIQDPGTTIQLPNPLVDQPIQPGPMQQSFSFYSDPLAAFTRPQPANTLAAPPPKKPRMAAQNLAPQNPPVVIMQPGGQFQQQPQQIPNPNFQVMGGNLPPQYLQHQNMPNHYVVGGDIPISRMNLAGGSGGGNLMSNVPANTGGMMGGGLMGRFDRGRDWNSGQRVEAKGKGKDRGNKGKGWKNIDATRYYKKSMVEDPWRELMKKINRGKKDAIKEYEFSAEGHLSESDDDLPSFRQRTPEPYIPM